MDLLKYDLMDFINFVFGNGGGEEIEEEKEIYFNDSAKA